MGRAGTPAVETGVRIRSWAMGLAFLILGPVLARASASGLVVVPTTDTVGAGQWCFELQVDGRLAQMSTEASCINFQMGLGDRFELGADWDISDGTEAKHRILFNAKWVFFRSEGGGVAVAAGAWDTSSHLKAMPYLVGSKQFDGLRVHVGATRSEALSGDRVRAYVAADRPLGEHATVMADYTAGEESAASLGLNWTFGPHLSVLVGLVRPNDGSGMEYSFHFNLAGLFAGTKQGR